MADPARAVVHAECNNGLLVLAPEAEGVGRVITVGFGAAAAALQTVFSTILNQS